MLTRLPPNFAINIPANGPVQSRKTLFSLNISEHGDIRMQVDSFGVKPQQHDLAANKGLEQLHFNLSVIFES